MAHESSRAHTSESLDTVPEHGEDNSGYDAEITEPETKRRPVKDGEGYMKSGTDSSVEDDDKGNDKVPKSYRWESLPPENPQNSASYIRNLSLKRLHVPTQSDSKHGAREFIDRNVRSVAYPVRHVIPSGPSSVPHRYRVHILVAPFARRCVSRRLWF